MVYFAGNGIFMGEFEIYINRTDEEIRECLREQFPWIVGIYFDADDPDTVIITFVYDENHFEEASHGKKLIEMALESEDFC